MYFLDPANANCEALESNIAVFSAGNYNKAASLYPGAMKGCVSVTATCPDYLPGGYSNYGAGCDIAAPGGDIIENSNNAPRMILSTGCTGSDFQKQDAYVYKFGTSMACPHVSGVIALGMSYALKLGKHFSREEFLSRLMTSAVDIDQYMLPGLTKLYYNSKTGNYEQVDVTAKKNKMGTGLVNAWNFLMALEGTPTYLTTPGETLVIDVAECIGDTSANFEFALEMDAADKTALGLSATPEIKNGKIEISCSKTGAGKIYLTSSVGKVDKIEGLDFHQEISIVSRPAVANNGGWL
jgi:subtilisin family serine protease